MSIFLNYLSKSTLFYTVHLCTFFNPAPVSLLSLRSKKQRLQCFLLGIVGQLAKIFGLTDRGMTFMFR